MNAGVRLQKKTNNQSINLYCPLSIKSPSLCQHDVATQSRRNRRRQKGNLAALVRVPVDWLATLHDTSIICRDEMDFFRCLRQGHSNCNSKGFSKLISIHITGRMLLACNVQLWTVLSRFESAVQVFVDWTLLTKSQRYHFVC